MNESRRHTLSAAACTVLLLGAGAFSRTPLVNALSLRSATAFTLETSIWYRVLGPISALFDRLTLLSVPQLLSAFACVLIVAALLRAYATLKRASTPEAYSVWNHLRFGANVFGAVLAVAGLALLAPRPMAALRAGGGGDLVVVDFHSHTSASHDGRPQFTPEANREWHRRSGFDVAYVTDHHTFAGAIAAEKANPHTAGEGTILLPGLEYLDNDEHLLALGLDPSSTDIDKHEWHPLFGASIGVPAVLILALPGDLATIPDDEAMGNTRLVGMEISDGSPRGLRQAATDRTTIVAIARVRKIAVVSGSDNHGWGNTAAAWSVMRIPGWRAMSPKQLDSSIRSSLRTNGAGAVEVIARRLPPANSALAIALTGPELALDAVRDLSWNERVYWLGWMWMIWAVALVRVRRRTSLSEPPSNPEHAYWRIECSQESSI